MQIYGERGTVATLFFYLDEWATQRVAHTGGET